MFSLHMLVLADVNGAFTGIAALFAGYLASILVLIFVIAGYQYMFALDDHVKAMQAKRAIGIAIVGAIVVALAATVVPDIINKIGH